MIPDSQVLEIITEQYPGIKMNIQKSKALRAFEHIADYAKGLLQKESYGEFKNFVEFINQLYYHCNNRMKLGIDNVFLYKIGNYIDVCALPHNIREMLPHRMKSLLNKQLGTPAI